MKDRLITFFIIISFVFCCVISKSCANTTTPPSGGPKDTIPPVLLKVTPQKNTTNFPRYGAKISLLYNEYTVVKTPADIYLSPPQKRKPTVKVKGKNIVVTFKDTLQADKTYYIDFGQALVDNNEGNIAPRLVYSFSTGNEIDSLFCTGTITDCQTLQPAKNVLIALYSDLSDSACFKTFPDAAVKSDEWGYFIIRNLKPIPYRIYAYTDEDSDSKYSASTDKIAFLDSAYVPSWVIRDSIYELSYFKMKDTVRCKARHPQLSLSLFTEFQTKQYIKNSGRNSKNMGFLKFNAPYAEINSFNIFGIDTSAVTTQFNPTRDSMLFWINTSYPLEDSLLLKINYMKTDSTGKLIPFTEDISLGLKNVITNDTKTEKPDSLLSVKITLDSETVEQSGVIFDFDYPLIQCTPDSIKFTETNPKNQTVDKKFILSQDSTDIRRYVFRSVEEYKPGYDYKISIPKGTFINLNHLPNKEEMQKITLPNSDNLSSITLDVMNTKSRYIFELVNEKRDKVFRKYILTSDTRLYFPYLKAGKYSIRITEDLNNNGIFDTGNLLAKRQPEKVLLYKLLSGTDIIEVPEKTDLEQTINMEEFFK
ncbi:MAG: Ig-like domain-containing protein [Bacteroidales bacterium]|jgi:hypothetical protein